MRCWASAWACSASRRGANGTTSWVDGPPPPRRLTWQGRRRGVGNASKRPDPANLIGQHRMQRLHGRRSLADAGGDPFDRTAAHVADGEDARPARLEEMRRALQLPRAVRNMGAGQHEVLLVEF